MWETWVQSLGLIPGFYPWVEKIPCRRERLPTPIFWPGEFYGLYDPWSHRVGHDRTTFTYHICDIYICIYTHKMTKERGQRASKVGGKDPPVESLGPKPIINLWFGGKVFKTSVDPFLSVIWR